MELVLHGLLYIWLRVSEDGFILIYRDQTTMPCLCAPIRAKQLSMATTVGVIWPYACVRYWPGRRLVYVCPLLVCLNLKTTFFRSMALAKAFWWAWLVLLCMFLCFSNKVTEVMLPLQLGLLLFH